MRRIHQMKHMEMKKLLLGLICITTLAGCGSEDETKNNWDEGNWNEIEWQ